MWTRKIAAALCLGALVLFPGTSLAVNGSKYCSAGTDSKKTGDTVPGSKLSVTDIILWTGSLHTASDCYGAIDTRNSGPKSETAALNEIFGHYSGGGSAGSEFVYLDRTGGKSNPIGLNGIRFVVHAYGGAAGWPGLWTIQWTDTSGKASQDFPLKIDLAVLLVGGGYSAAYLLTGVLLPLNPGAGIGIFDIQFSNGGSKCYARYDDHKILGSKGDRDQHKEHCDKPKNPPKFSHLLLAGRIAPTQIPEPVSPAMFGAGLLALWIVGRRRLR
jgi:hypothetical protein